MHWPHNPFKKWTPEKTQQQLSVEKNRALIAAVQQFYRDPAIHKIGHAFRERAVIAIMDAVPMVDSSGPNDCYRHYTFDHKNHQEEAFALKEFFPNEGDFNYFLPSLAFENGYKPIKEWGKERSEAFIRRHYADDALNIRKMLKEDAKNNDFTDGSVERLLYTLEEISIKHRAEGCDLPLPEDNSRRFSWVKFKDDLNLAYARAPDEDVSNCMSLLRTIKEAADRSGLFTAIGNAYGVSEHARG